MDGELVVELFEDELCPLIVTFERTDPPFPLIITFEVLLTFWKADPFPELKSLLGKGGGEFSLEEWGASPKSYLWRKKIKSYILKKNKEPSVLYMDLK